MINNLSYSEDGLLLTEKSEGVSLTSYQDSGGVWTIGYGHTGPDVGPNLTITQDQAQKLLEQDLLSAEQTVNQFVEVPLDQEEFDALVDFVFNVGQQNFVTSTLLRLLNNNDYLGAAQQLPRWDKCNGEVLNGLLERRHAEENMFQDGMNQTRPA